MRPAGALLALAPLFASACAEVAAPDSLALTGGQRAVVAAPTLGSHVRVEADGGAAWIDYELGASSWSAGETPDTWSAIRPDGASFQKSSEELALAAGERRFRAMPELDGAPDLPRLEAGAFAAIGDRLHLRLAPGERPSGTLRFSVRKPRARGANPALAGWTGAGFDLWTGESMGFELALGARRALRFFWASEGLGASGEESAAHLRITLDGALVAEEEQRAGAKGAGRWLSVPLPAEARAHARIAFELGGDPSFAAVLALRVVRLEPAPAARANLVLFLADTFRADNLALTGGEAALAPQLNALAAQSVSFTNARSPSTWTLPAQASMLTGLYPEQHGAVSLGRAIPSELETLSEFLAAHGYRTGAVTDSAFVSRHYGFDQGFEWFQEDRTWDLGETLRAAREFLEQDDGRPAFLFVHTYRTHAPYRTGPEEDRGALRRVVEALRASCKEYGGDGSVPALEAGARLRQVYRAGVAALDQRFGAWWPEIERRFPHSFLVFTSDHGEAFYEHEEVGHGGIPWEEKIRIPLFVHGPGLVPRAVAFSASLVDLPATFAALAGLTPPAAWQGRDLLALDAARTAYSFVRIGAAPMVALIAGSHKVFGAADPEALAAGKIRGATDLAADPREDENQADRAWPAELARAEAAAVARLLRSAGAPRAVELSSDQRQFLNSIGYGGE